MKITVIGAAGGRPMSFAGTRMEMYPESPFQPFVNSAGEFL